jgi:hypothetical protein
MGRLSRRSHRVGAPCPRICSRLSLISMIARGANRFVLGTGQMGHETPLEADEPANPGHSSTTNGNPGLSTHLVLDPLLPSRLDG